ncbi:hypothetical protein ACLM5H_11775 [Fredinandcohnia humi]
MNKVFEKYKFPGSSPKKVLIPRVIQKDTQSQMAIQLKLDFVEQDSKDNIEVKGV